MIAVIIVTHGDFGAYLLESAEHIIGEQKECVDVISISARTSAEMARETIVLAVEKYKNAAGVIFLTDMLGGTPTNISVPVAARIANSAVISGINLNMVIAVFSYRDKMSIGELAEKAVDDGRKGVCDVKKMFAAMRRE